MELKFKNSEIYFVLSDIWSIVDYRFKYHINTIVKANDDEDYEQTVAIDVDTLIKCCRAVSQSPYGYTTDMAETLLSSLKTQLMAEANIVEYQAYIDSLETASPLPKVEPNEYTQVLLAIAELKEADVATKNYKIAKGKEKILA